MDRPSGKVDRRSFIKGTIQAVAGIAATGCADRLAGEGTKGIASRAFGKTGLTLPVLGFGGAALPAVFGNPLTIDKRIELVQYAYDRGIRYYDTSPVYMESEYIIGEALKDKRADVYLATKVETTQPEDVKASVDRSLKALQTDHLDFVLIHGTPGIEQMSVVQAMKVHAALLKLKEQGTIRFIGFSAHGYFDKAFELINTKGFDQCMLSYGYIPRGYDQMFSAKSLAKRKACLEKAKALGMGIIAMKVVGAGMLGAWAEAIIPEYEKKNLRRLPGAAIRWTLQDKRIDMLDIGMRLKSEIDDNIAILSGIQTYTSEDRRLLSAYTKRLYTTDMVKKMRID